MLADPVADADADALLDEPDPELLELQAVKASKPAAHTAATDRSRFCFTKSPFLLFQDHSGREVNLATAGEQHLPSR